MLEFFEIVVRVVIWTGIIAFTWSVSSSLEKIADALSKQGASQDS